MVQCGKKLSTHIPENIATPYFVSTAEFTLGFLA